MGELFGADIRSLALLRVVLAIVVLIDLAGRAHNLRAHYTDAGVLPRGTVMSTLNQWRWSLGFANGTLTFQALLFSVTGLAALALLVGYRTRVMSIIVWILVISIQIRNPWTLSGADTLLRMLLFWAMLLPLGSCWSFEMRFRAAPITRRSLNILSFATFGIFMQIAFMYWFTAALKSSPEWMSEGTALFYATGAGQIARPFGEYLHQFPTLLRILTHASLGLEVLAPLLLFFPFLTGPVRTAAAVSIMAFHAGIYLTLDVGMFSFTSALCMICFLPTWFWDAALPRLGKIRMQDVPFIRQAKEFVVPPGLARSGGMRGNGAESSDAALAPVVNVFAALCLLLVFGWNMTYVTDFRMPKASMPVAYGLGLYQKWDMFAPRPVASTRWYVVRGELQNGQEVNLITPIVYGDLDNVSLLTWERPDDIAGTYYRDTYWRKYVEAIGGNNKGTERKAFAGYACRTWNGHYGGDVMLTRLEIYLMVEPTLPGSQEAPVRKSLIAEYECTL